MQFIKEYNCQLHFVNMLMNKILFWPLYLVCSVQKKPSHCCLCEGEMQADFDMQICLVAITGIFILVSYLLVKSLQLIGRSGTRRFHLRVPDLQMSYWDLIASWWSHQMKILSTLLALCAGNAPVTVEFPSQRSVTWSFDVFFCLRLNKRFSKQSRHRWLETPSRSLWRHCNVTSYQYSSPSNNYYVVCPIINNGPYWDGILPWLPVI